MSAHTGLIAQVSSGNAGGTVGLTSRPNRHAIGSDLKSDFQYKEQHLISTKLHLLFLIETQRPEAT
ncbi:hypothetical protein E2C01_046341 [Portunus trituberculatus]|uniref:Uncharacterized protein n=1 Tax=Portunus trituberculatus TaxID=210409 RepID=A0A5B7FY78_PORTR|nr:hypothetical protein [Portunus trituberculatus]